MFREVEFGVWLFGGDRLRSSRSSGRDSISSSSLSGRTLIGHSGRILWSEQSLDSSGIGSRVQNWSEQCWVLVHFVLWIIPHSWKVIALLQTLCIKFRWQLSYRVVSFVCRFKCPSKANSKEETWFESDFGFWYCNWSRGLGIVLLENNCVIAGMGE